MKIVKCLQKTEFIGVLFNQLKGIFPSDIEPELNAATDGGWRPGKSLSSFPFCFSGAVPAASGCLNG